MTAAPHPIQATPASRREALERFVTEALGAPVELVAASADASFRSYWRARAGASSYVVMDAPPDKENIGAWLDIDARLRGAGLHAPEVIAADAALGFVLMEDLGDRLYLGALDAASVDALYADALDALIRMQTHVDSAGLPPFDDAFVARELELMPTWFLERHLGVDVSCDDWDRIELAFRVLIDGIRAQPRAFMHRDYHSRNLVVVERHGPGIIDFQDAVVGPIAYDLASLLRDCYIAWDIERVDGWVEAYHQRLRRAHLVDEHVDGARFRRWFDLAGLQRHLKVLGLFCRLHYRDGKTHYLGDLPRVRDYVVSVARHYEELAPLAELIERAIGERDISRPRADDAS